MPLELVQACSICNEPIHMVPKLVQACSIRSTPIHTVSELVHAYSICNEPIHMVLKLEQACTDFKKGLIHESLAIYYIVGKRPSKYTLNISPSCTSCTPCGMQAKALTVYKPSILLLLK